MSDQEFGEMFRGPDAPVTTFMATLIVTVPSDATLRGAAEVLIEAGVGCIVVGAPDEVEGVLSERDLVRAISEGRDPDTTTVAEMESTQLVWTTTDASIATVAEEMMTDYVRHILVGEDGILVGIVSMRDIVAAYTT